MVTKIAFVDENRFRGFLRTINNNGGNDAKEHQAALRLEKNFYDDFLRQKDISACGSKQCRLEGCVLEKLTWKTQKSFV